MLGLTEWRGEKAMKIEKVSVLMMSVRRRRRRRRRRWRRRRRRRRRRRWWRVAIITRAC
jgi:hypothetical protein